MASPTLPLTTMSLFESIKYKFLKFLTLVVFFCLPRKLTSVFVSLSIVTMILKLRDHRIQSDQPLLNRIEQFLKINVSKDIFAIPDQTVTWFWSQQVLNTLIEIRGEQCPLRTLLLDTELFLRNRTVILNTLLGNLPMSVRYKLKLNEVENRNAVKHNIVSVLMHA